MALSFRTHPIKLPRIRVKGVLVEEVTSSVDLPFVERHYESHVRYGLRANALQRSLVCRFRSVQPLPLAERGAHRRSDQQVQCLLAQERSGFVSLGFCASPMEVRRRGRSS